MGTIVKYRSLSSEDDGDSEGTKRYPLKDWRGEQRVGGQGDPKAC